MKEQPLSLVEGQAINGHNIFTGPMIPLCVMRRQDLNGNEKLLWCRLYSYSTWDDGSVYPSQKKLAEDLGLTESGIKQLLRGLREKGLIRRTAPTGVERWKHWHNRYEIVLQDWMIEAATRGTGIALAGSKARPSCTVVNKTLQDGGVHDPPLNALSECLEYKQQAAAESRSTNPQDPRLTVLIRYGIGTPTRDRMLDDYPQLTVRQIHQVHDELSPNAQTGAFVNALRDLGEQLKGGRSAAVSRDYTLIPRLEKVVY